MAKLTWEWSDRMDGQIIVRKARGQITVNELREFLSESRNYDCFAGMLAVIQWCVRSGDDL